MKKRLLMAIPLLTLLFSSCGGSIPSGEEIVTPAESEAEKKIKEIYNLYKANGGELSYEEWLATIKGEKGDTGNPGKDGSTLLSGIGEPSINLGKAGDMYLDISTYDLYSKNDSGWAKIGNFKGADGEPGQPGDQGEPGEDGKSAYEIAVEHGFTGTEEEWLESLKGEDGETPEMPIYVTGVTYENNIIYVHYSDGHVEEIKMTPSEDPTTFDVEFDFNEFPFEGTTKEYSNNSIEDKHISVVLENYASSFEDITITKIEVPEKEKGYTGLKVIEFEGVELPDLKTLELASRKNDGFLNLAFDHKITEVTITAQPYYKCYEDHWTTGKSMIVYTADAIDEDLGKLVVNGETWEMPGCTYDENWMITEAPAIESKTFEINGNELSISAFVENRMYVHKIAFTFEK